MRFFLAAIFFAGFVLLALGLWLFYHPAAYIVIGLMLMGMSLSLNRSKE